MNEADAVLPSQNELAEDLGKIRTRAVGQPVTGLDLMHLAPVVRELAADPDLPLHRLIEDSLRRAIERFGPGPYQVGVLAIFGFERNERGELQASPKRQTVEDRRDKAADVFGLTPDSFDRLRGRGVLEDVAGQLLVLLSRHRVAVSFKPSYARHLDDRDPEVNVLQNLASLASDLHYASLTSLFVASADSTLTREDYRPNRWTVWDACSDQLFEAYIPLRVLYKNYIDFLNDDRLYHLPQEAARSLASLLTSLIESGPSFGFYPLWIIGQYWDAGKGSRTDPDDALRSIYDEVWTPWYQGNLVHHDDASWPPTADKISIDHDQPLAIESLVIKSGVIEQVIARRITYNSPILSRARQTAHKKLGYYFDINEWAPVLDGRSLRDRADIYFDSQRAKLAQEAIV